MASFKINDKVDYIDGKRNFTYEIVQNQSGISIKNSLYNFGYDNTGFPRNNFIGRFDFILAEYDSNKHFVKNIACTNDEITPL